MRSFTESPAPSCAHADRRHRCGWLGGERSWMQRGCLSRLWVTESPAGQIRPLLVHEPDYMRQRRIIAQLAVLVAGNVVDLADRREHLRLLDGVNAKVSFQIEVHIQHVFWIAGLFHHQLEDAVLHRIVSALLRGRHCRSCWIGWVATGAGTVAGASVSGDAGAPPARSGRFSYTNRITCANVG